MQETKERFFLFIEKLEDKLTEFAEAAIPELTALNNTDTDEFKRKYHLVKSGVLGQLESIIKKAREVYEDKITYFPYPESKSSAFYLFRNECQNRLSELEELDRAYRTKIEDTFQEDYEIKYQKILDEYAIIQNKFHCSQCGSPVVVDKLYFTTTYISCASCGTRNTFEPSTQAKMLEHLGRDLAEQRTKHLLKAYEEIPGKMQELYLKGHKMKLSLIHEKDKNIIQQKNIQIQEIEKAHKELEEKSPQLYQKYLRAMFDEWNKINPDMQQEHEKFYNRLLIDHKIH